MTSEPAADSAKRLGDYEVLYELSAGGMGEVLLARKRGTAGFERHVAIKTIRSEYRREPRLRAMFLDEALLLSKIRHPAIAQVFDFGEHEGTLYLVMEYVAGVSFGDLLAEVVVPPGLACRAVAQACRGLHAAHELHDEHGVSMGVVHRDVSPDNLMLTFEGAVQVLDFGIALMRGREAPVTEFGTIKGKPPYLSPEQVRGESIDRRSDIFSASVVLWEMLTGKPLFSGYSIYEVTHSVLSSEIAKPSSLVRDLPSDLDEIIMCGLSRDRDGRFDTALALAEALTTVAGKMGAESLDGFATRELRQKREAHRKWLTEIAQGGGKARAGRPTGVGTQVGSDAGAGQASTQLAAEVDPTVLGAEVRAGETSPRLSRRNGILALVIALAAGGLGLGWLLMGQPAPIAETLADAEPVMAAVPADSAPADAAVAAAALVMDAAAEDVVDAGSARNLARRNRPPRTKRDAGTRVRARPDAAPATRAGYGVVDIAADPWARIVIDGRGVGNSPQFGYRLSAGSHKIEFYSPATGELRYSKTVVIEADGKHRVVAPKL